ncbi:hypothetical protein [Pseudomonas parafulva]|uniref:hypothetical protein n=1 Tax=Pseudomonas parafulva TaxID=157782 RepID=UPI000734B6E7|nr:hypothetical protein [Pseudomonas parafulva]KTS99784.1 hypothetical protein NS212_07765 [Pseudomonas parafulva]
MKTIDKSGNDAGQLDPEFGVGGILQLSAFDDQRGFGIIDSADLQDGRSVHVLRTHDDAEYYLVSFDKLGALIHREQVILPYETPSNIGVFFRLNYSRLDQIACYLPGVRWPSENEADPIIQTSAVGCFLTSLQPRPGFGQQGIAVIKPSDLGEANTHRHATHESKAVAADHIKAPAKPLDIGYSGDAQLVNGALWSISTTYHEFHNPPFRSWIAQFAPDTGKLVSVFPLELLGNTPWEPVDVHFLQGGGFIMLAYREEQAYLAKFSDTGMLDTTFNDSGYVEMPGLDYDNSCMHVHQDRILIASTERVPREEPLLKLEAYLFTGQRDSTFKVKNDVVRNAAHILSPHIAVDAENRILVGLNCGIVHATDAAMIFRFKWDGTADLSFGDAGRFVLPDVVQFKHMFVSGNEIRGAGKWFSSQKDFMFKVLD